MCRHGKCEKVTRTHSCFCSFAPSMFSQAESCLHNNYKLSMTNIPVVPTPGRAALAFRGVRRLVHTLLSSSSISRTILTVTLRVIHGGDGRVGEEDALQQLGVALQTAGLGQGTLQVHQSFSVQRARKERAGVTKKVLCEVSFRHDGVQWPAGEFTRAQGVKYTSFSPQQGHFLVLTPRVHLEGNLVCSVTHVWHHQST